MNSFDVFVLKYIATKSFFFVLFTLAGFFLIPAISKSYLLWKRTRKKNDFLGTCIQLLAASFCLIIVYPFFIEGVIKINYFPLFSSHIYNTMLFVLPAFISAFFASKTYDWWQKQKNKESIKNLSLVWICGLISFYCVSTYFIICLHQSLILTI